MSSRASVILHCIGPTVVVRLDFSGDVLAWLLLVVLLSWCLNISIWDNCDSRSYYLFLCLLGGCSIPWLCCPLWFLGEYGSCQLGMLLRSCQVWPLEILPGVATWTSGEKVFLGIRGLTLRDREGLDEDAGFDPRIGCRDGGETSTCGLLQRSGDETGFWIWRRGGSMKVWRSSIWFPGWLDWLTPRECVGVVSKIFAPQSFTFIK